MIRAAWKRGFAALLLATMLVTTAFAQTSTMTEGEWWDIQLAQETFRLQRVADPDSRRQGLMGRELAADEGMLFDFPAGTVPAIWMRNMRISLDLVYVDDDGHIANIFSAVPPCHSMPCAIYRADRALRFVLELPAGTAGRLRLMGGQKLQMDELLALPVPSE
ncbi:DUF192 domain-containing protein [Halopseudomonas pelagia]|uniref:DUF192 domain-containing protein n=1 Tax=Halopseudomonas pelagia TaxID=553151 RepID=UPI0003A0BB1C|nr:DUF192 domain-containing protein [Halopseudomonas pelagia]|tara:strand:- start:1214 stop:1702 length:489 start_codon:yes stop_codon:yes gene_type:complete